MSATRGGRDLTFPDGSEGGLWVEPSGFTVTVNCPTRFAVDAVVAALLELPRQQSGPRRPAQRRRRRTPRARR